MGMKERLERWRQITVAKQSKRRGDGAEKKNSRGRVRGSGSPVAFGRNPDFGCPYRGPDKFSGQWKKFNDRAVIEFYEEGKRKGQQYIRLYPFFTNKFEGSYASNAYSS